MKNSGGIYTKSDTSGDIRKFCTNLKSSGRKVLSKSSTETTVEYITRQKDKLVLTMRHENEIISK